MTRLEPALQMVADKIMHDLPIELAGAVTVRLHEGGDGLVITYPSFWEGMQNFNDLDHTIRAHGGTWVNRGKNISYFLVPRPKPSLIEKTEQAVKTVQNIGASQDAFGEKTASGGARPAVAEAPKPAEPPKSVNVVHTVNTVNAPVPNDVKPQPLQSDKVTDVQSNKVTAEPEKPAPPPQSTASQAPAKTQDRQPQPKQPSPIATFKAKVCVDCADVGSCNVDQMKFCFYVLEMEAFADISRLLRDVPLALSDVSAQFSKIVDSLEKVASRPSYRGGGGKQLSKERHVDGGISWFWTSELHINEKALDSENKDSKEYAMLKTQLTDAASAGKRGLVVGAYWCFLDSFKKDGVLRKKAQDYPNSSAGGSK